MAARPLRIILGVGGGIAAYKVAALLRLLTEAGHDVHVVPTRAALNFVGSATWEALSGHPVSAEVWDNVAEVPHVALGKSADLVIVAPATADLMSRVARGAADDLLTNVLLTATCPVVLAPAMHTEMWHNAATVANVQVLRSRGVHVMEPAVGRLTGTDSGPGRMPEPDAIVEHALALVGPRDLQGLHVVVSAGGTREYLDPVRFLGNRSSGKQGVALAQRAAARGAHVTLVAANLEVPIPVGVDVVRVETSEQMLVAMSDAAPTGDIVVMAAAVADYAPVASAPEKIKKSGVAPIVELRETTDILAHLSARRRPGQTVVGFAAETGDATGTVLEHGLAKLARKGCDALVVNDVRGDRAFGSDDNEVTIVSASGQIHVSRRPKDQIADAIWDALLAQRQQ